MASGDHEQARIATFAGYPSPLPLARLIGTIEAVPVELPRETLELIRFKADRLLTDLRDDAQDLNIVARRSLPQETAEEGRAFLDRAVAATQQLMAALQSAEVPADTLEDHPYG